MLLNFEIDVQSTHEIIFFEAFMFEHIVIANISDKYEVVHRIEVILCCIEPVLNIVDTKDDVD
jgi:hypothetical protein